MSNFTPNATAEVDAEQAAAGTAAFQEGGFGFNSDIAVTELQKFAAGLVTISSANLKALEDQAAGLLAISAASLKATENHVIAARNINAATLDNMVGFNAAHLSNLVNSASHRHSELAADRQWNLNETDAYSVLAIDATGENVKKVV